MSNVELGRQGHRLLEDLRHLFGGNHVDANSIAATAEATEAYLVTAFVTWRFEHDITTSTSKGNAAVSGGHFDYRSADYQSHLQKLCQQAVRNRDIRGPFMQRVDAARSTSLEWSTSPRVVHDFGSYSVFRQCGGCRGSGKVSCGGCSGGGKRSCGGCGGVGWRSRVVTHTRWNGRYNETHSQTVRDSCGSCGGRGRVVCTSCGGSGRQTCGACAGHGFFTDVSRVQSIARPRWSVPTHTGLASEFLVRALVARGPAAAGALVPLDLAGTGYNESDNWVVRYEGLAEVVELGVDVLKTCYSIAAVGSNVIPIATPPVFDQLLQRELKLVSELSTGKRGPSKVRRQAKNLFSAFRGVPLLDSCLQAVAKLAKGSRSEPASAISKVAQGFISAGAAKSIGNSMLHVLDKVSPANSRAAWAAVVAFPVIGAFVATANSFFNAFSPADPWEALLPLGYALLVSALAVLLVSPAAWLLSAIVSYLMRLKVPVEYRQRGRNWAPLRKACGFSLAASFAGALYGAAGAMHWVPSVRDSAEPAVTYAIAHTEPGTDARRYLTQLVGFQPTPLPNNVVTETDTMRGVQRYLIVHGYLHGQADGNIGPQTSAAVARYERREHLSPGLPPADLLAYMKQH